MTTDARAGAPSHRPLRRVAVVAGLAVAMLAAAVSGVGASPAAAAGSSGRTGLSDAASSGTGLSGRTGLSGAGSSGAATCTYPAIRNQVLVVFDFGNVPEVEGTRPAQAVTTVCVVIEAGAMSIDVLYAALRQLGWTWRTQGMLCGIAGYPATGCGDPSGTRFLYWSYWKGDGGVWSYSDHGPGFARSNCGRVEGWRFIDGAVAVGAAEMPRASGLARGMCAPAPTPPATTAPPSGGGATGTMPTGTNPTGTNPTGQGPPSTAPGAVPSTTPPSSVVAGATPASDPGPSTPPGEPAEGAWANVQTPAERRSATSIPATTKPSTRRAGLGFGIGLVVIAAVVATGVLTSRRRLSA